MKPDDCPRDKLADRIADAEERLRNSISQRIERNRAEVARLQQENKLFELRIPPQSSVSMQVAGLSATHAAGHDKSTASVRVKSSVEDSPCASYVDHMAALHGEAACGCESIGQCFSVQYGTVAGVCAEAHATMSGCCATGDIRVQEHQRRAREPGDVAGDDKMAHAPSAARRVDSKKESCATKNAPHPAAGPLVLRMTVEIGDGRTDEVRVRQGDTPDDLAATFCSLHGLGEKARALLTNHIASNLANVSRMCSTRATGATSLIAGGSNIGVLAMVGPTEVESDANLHPSNALATPSQPFLPHNGIAKQHGENIDMSVKVPRAPVTIPAVSQSRMHDGASHIVGAPHEVSLQIGDRDKAYASTASKGTGMSSGDALHNHPLQAELERNEYNSSHFSLSLCNARGDGGCHGSRCNRRSQSAPTSRNGNRAASTASKASPKFPRGTPNTSKSRILSLGTDDANLHRTTRGEVQRLGSARATSAPRGCLMRCSRNQGSDLQICDRSRKLVAMRGARGDVFERLHSEFYALEQRKTAIRSHIDDQELASQYSQAPQLAQVSGTSSPVTIVASHPVDRSRSSLLSLIRRSPKS